MANKWSDTLVNDHGSCSPNDDFGGNLYVRDYDIPLGQWKKACRFIDDFLKEFLQVVNKELPPFLKITGCYRSGSARDGLKSIEPDEFDVIFNFEVVGNRITHDGYLRGNDGEEVTGITKLRVQNHGPENTISRFTDAFGYVNALKLKDKLKGIFDTAIYKMNILQNNTKKVTRKEHRSGIHLVLRVNEGWNSNSVYNIDVIPGFKLDLPGLGAFAVMKNMGKKNFNIPENEKNFCWRVSTSSYEKDYIDKSLAVPGGRILWTAHRIMKCYLQKLKDKNPLNQLPSIVKSYHLKNICMTIFQETGHEIVSTKQAIDLILSRLESCLAKGEILYFFHGNTDLKREYFDCPFLKDDDSNLLETMSPETLNQARRAFHETKQTFNGLFDENPGWFTACALS